MHTCTGHKIGAVISETIIIHIYLITPRPRHSVVFAEKYTFYEFTSTKNQTHNL